MRSQTALPQRSVIGLTVISRTWGEGGGGGARQYEQELPTKLRIPGPEHSFERIGKELKAAQQPNDEHPLEYGEELARVRFGNPRSMVVEQADVFISYSRHDAADALAIASGLNERGIKVWYDVSISGGDRFAAKIESQLEAARAVVVLWSPESIKSDWVAYEAAKAHKQNKLVPICLPPLATENVPPPYPAVLNIIRYGDQERLLSALARLGVAVPGP